MEGLREWWESPGQDIVWSLGWGPGSHADKTGQGQIRRLERGGEEGSGISWKTGQQWLSYQQTVSRSSALPLWG